MNGKMQEAEAYTIAKSGAALVRKSWSMVVTTAAPTGLGGSTYLGLRQRVRSTGHWSRAGMKLLEVTTSSDSSRY